ncbi:hypothetical protein FS837_007460 [Tulasnella sp. UAMH 9824]|nr:hypothetical protein FS837_007460 [Tulasnella sp. UAMH 9824]
MTVPARITASVAGEDACTALPNELRPYHELQYISLLGAKVSYQPTTSTASSIKTTQPDTMIYPERDATDLDAKSDSGVTSFSASTDTTLKSDPPAQEPVVREDSGFTNPPPYNSAGPSSPPPTSPPSARVNHLYIYRHNDSVRGSYTVDVDLVIPPQLLPNPVPGEALHNLKLASNNGGVTGDVVLVGRGDKRASLVAESKNGGVKFKVLSRRSCPFRLVAQSSNGAVTVYIPRDFIGPITSTTDNGGLDLSDAIKQTYYAFSEDGKATKGFIGDWTSSGYGDILQSGGEWVGDELVVGSKNGRVKVYYIDELNAASGGFFSSLFRGFT